MDKRTINISLVANAGLLLELGDTKILVDALWRDSEAYSRPPVDIQAQWLSRESDNKWCNADYLIFTHLHNDHFEQYTVIEYLQHNKVREVWFEPQPEVEDTAALCRYMQEHGIEHRNIGGDYGRQITYRINPDIDISAICTAHMGIHAHQKHNALLIRYMDKHILLVADAQFPDTAFAAALDGIRPEAVFVNPVHFYSRKALQSIIETLQAKKIIVYHTPFANEGNSVFRRMISKKMPQIAEQISVELLWNVGDCLTI